MFKALQQTHSTELGCSIERGASDVQYSIELADLAYKVNIDLNNPNLRVQQFHMLKSNPIRYHGIPLSMHHF